MIGPGSDKKTKSANYSRKWLNILCAVRSVSDDPTTKWNQIESPQSKDTESLFEKVGILCLYLFPADLVNGCERIE